LPRGAIRLQFVEGVRQRVRFVDVESGPIAAGRQQHAVAGLQRHLEHRVVRVDQVLVGPGVR
jgi:hypothetical protein